MIYTKVTLILKTQAYRTDCTDFKHCFLDQELELAEKGCFQVEG